jgi:polyketide biosynthesis enoyl-CoA hydratase PksI
MSERFALRPVSEGVIALIIATERDAHFDADSLAAFCAAVDELCALPELRAVLIAGAGSHFCAGASSEVLVGDDPAPALATLMSELPRRLLSIPVPTIAAVEGHAVGGGLVWSLWSDVAIFAEESLYGANFVDLGITPGMGATVLLEEMFGPGLARELMYSGRLLKGRELRSLSRLSPGQVLPRAEVWGRAVTLAEDIAQASPAAVRALKAHSASKRHAQLELALASERRMHAELLAQTSTRERLRERVAAPEEKS